MTRGPARGPARARALAADVRTGRVAAATLVERALAAAAASPSNAFLALASERARRRAAEIDAAVAAGRDPGPLAGVPVAVKDNICTDGVATTAGSAILDGFVPPYDATVVARLEAAGAIVVAKTNLDEFGMGSSSESSAFGPVRHPTDPGRVAGGSSGGSAVAVAEGVVTLALGTDTGGSVRQPAAFCGLLGIKPTYGRLSRYGVIAYGSSLDQVGVFAHDPEDAAIALAAMAGVDPADATSVGRDRAELTIAPLDPRGLRVGRLVSLWDAGVAPGVRAALDGVAARCEALGAELVDVPLPLADAAVASYYLIATAEASSNLARFDATLYGRRVGAGRDGHEAVARSSRAAGLGREVQRRVLMGAFALSAGYADAYAERAARVRRRIADALSQALQGVDVLLAPTAPTVAWRLGERLHDPLSMYVADVATCLANLAGLPALSLPAGPAEEGLPAGAQLIGPAWSEGRLLAWASALMASGPAPSR
jgi:aspartyl-tRNA(Asn)/glutamyl-tRNA(Gln) amidotransferase subunit A